VPSYLVTVDVQLEVEPSPRHLELLQSAIRRDAAGSYVLEARLMIVTLFLSAESSGEVEGLARLVAVRALGDAGYTADSALVVNVDSRERAE